MSTGDMAELGPNNHDRRPVPDPTELTNALVDKASMSLQKLIESRLDGMDKAIKLLGDATDKFPAFVDMKIGHLRDLHHERFTSIEKLMEVQFAALSKLSEQLDTGNKVAIAAALQAQKEMAEKQSLWFTQLTLKQETTSTKETDGLKVLIQSEKKSTDEKISATEVRVTRIESIGVGRVTAEKDTQTDKSSMVSMVAVVVAIFALVASIIISVVTKMAH